MSDEQNPPPPPLRWPKIAAACVTLFFVACVFFMAKEYKRVQRIQRATQEMKREMQSTSPAPSSVTVPAGQARTNGMK
jgi:hypothetical protein